MTIQGRRMPSCDDVRSLILPKNGLATIANKEPVPATTAKLFGACSIPTSELTFNANVTSSGARKIRLVPIKANVYSEMKPQPTVPIGRDFAFSAGSAPCGNPSGPLVKDRCGLALRWLSPGGKRSLIALSSAGMEPDNYRKGHNPIGQAGRCCRAWLMVRRPSPGRCALPRH